MKLLSQTDRHPKMSKNAKVGVLSAIMHLAPADSSGFEVCPARSEGCTKACLHYSGHQTQRKFNARRKRTEWFFEDRMGFMLQLRYEIALLVRRAWDLDLRPAVRLNGTSDIPWEVVNAGGGLNIMKHYPEVAFYDYTKRVNRRWLPDNYKLVFSRSEDNGAACVKAIKSGMNVAVVFAPALPEVYRIGNRECPVVDGDAHDFRYGEYEQYDSPVVIGLTAKGKKGREDQSGFVVRVPA